MNRLFQQNKRHAKSRWGPRLGTAAMEALRHYSEDFQFSIAAGDLLLLDTAWYVTNSGLTRLARRNGCSGIEVQPLLRFSNPAVSRWAFKATVYTSRSSRGFAGYGDADPSNISPLLHGAEMRIAETRAVNRALRKAFGVGICSLEELGSFAERAHSQNPTDRIPPQPVDANYGGPKVRDRLCQIIRQHSLDPALVKAYATEFCGAKALREATREQVEKFVSHLADWAAQDRDALLCQLNSYLPAKGSAA